MIPQTIGLGLDVILEYGISKTGISNKKRDHSIPFYYAPTPQTPPPTPLTPTPPPYTPTEIQEASRSFEINSRYPFSRCEKLRD